MTKTFALALILTLVVGCAPQKPTFQPPVIPVYKATMEEVSVYKDFIGQTYGLYDISVRARVDGYLEGIHFKEGGKVNKGQLLYSIDPAPLNAKVAESMSLLAQAKTNLIKAESDYNRYKPLVANKAVSQSDYDAVVASYGAAQASLEAAQASLDYAKIQQSYTKIYAPISGIIGASEAKVGDYVGLAPNPVVLNTISQLDTILVHFYLTELQYLNLSQLEKAQQAIAEPNNPGKEAEVQLFFANGSRHPYLGRVDFVGRNINPTTGTILVQASFPNPKETVRPGQFARLRIGFAERAKAVVIPLKCLQEVQGQYHVYVVNDKNEVEFKSVEAGETLQDIVIIRQGISPGDLVILEGTNRVRTGMQITPQPQEFVSVRTEEQ